MKYYVGIDLGGTNIAGGIIDENGKFVISKSIKTLSERGFDAIVHDINALVINMMKEAEILNVEYIGIGSPGAIDTTKGKVLFAGNLQWNDAPLAEKVEEISSIKTYVANDANCAAIGESIAATVKKSMAMITIGTGVGFGFVKDGKVFMGDTYGGAELGHQKIMIGGEMCACGKRGCIEAYASFSALIRSANNFAQKNKKSYLAYIKKTTGNIDGEKIFNAAISGDIDSVKIVDEFISYIGEAVCSVINLLDPANIVIGGGICKSANYFLPKLEKYVIENAFCLKAGIPNISVAKLGNYAGILGAAKIRDFI